MIEPENVKFLSSGCRFGEFQVVRSLGFGTFGAVYAAQWIPYDRMVALKVLHQHVAVQREAVERFKREATTAGDLRHPHIVDVQGVGEIENTPFIAMELLEGESLASLLKRETRLPVERAVDLTLPVLDAVATMHAAGIVHRDLKPGNLFIARDAHGKVRPKVLDFGLAKMTQHEPGEGLTGTHAMLGTPNYMSPEQIKRTREAGVESDQFSLGVVLYEMLTGQKPFEGPNAIETLNRIIQGTCTPLDTRRPELPRGLCAAVHRALEGDPSRRHPSIRAMGAALLPFASEPACALWSHAFARASENPPEIENTSNNTLDPLERVRVLASQRATRRAREPREIGALLGAWSGLFLCGIFALRGCGDRRPHTEASPHAVVSSPVATRPPPPPTSIPQTVAPVESPRPVPVQIPVEPPAPVPPVSAPAVSALAPTPPSPPTVAQPPRPSVVSRPAVIPRPIVRPSPSVTPRRPTPPPRANRPIIL